MIRQVHAYLITRVTFWQFFYLATSVTTVVVWLSTSSRHSLVNLKSFWSQRLHPPPLSREQEVQEVSRVCCSQGKQKSPSFDDFLFVITPTYRRPEQKAELTRLAQTIDSVSGPLHWIVATDTEECDRQVEELLSLHFGQDKSRYVSYTLLASPMPSVFRDEALVKRFGLPRGVAGRRAGLNWIKAHTNKSNPAVTYFADDDNTYDLRIFKEIRKTKGISMFPVGLLRPAGVRGPLVDAGGSVIGFVGSSRPFLRFPVDMAGFAFSVKLLHSKDPQMPYRATFEEDGFLRSMDIKYSDIEVLASSGTEILVWHTMTAAPEVKAFKRPLDENLINVEKLLDNMVKEGLASVDQVKGADLPLCVGTTCDSSAVTD